MPTIAPASTPEDIAAAARLFAAYAAALDVDLSFQNFAAEQAGLPGKYAPPAGAFLLAHHHGAAIGCVTLRPFDGARCEMKRLYIAPEGRGLGLGRALVNAIITAATEAGYSEMLLDTLPTMTAAITLYKSFGFQPIAPYYNNPVPGAIYLSLKL